MTDVGTFRLYVRFPDGEIWHGVYDSVTDTAARFLTLNADDVVGWAMECDYREDGDHDGQGDPVELATQYGGGFWWPATATREWITSNRDPFETDGHRDGTPDWLAEYFAARAGEDDDG